MRVAAFGFALMALAGSASAGVYDGLYRDTRLATASCDIEMLQSDGGPMQIADGVLTYVESDCQLTKPVAVRGFNATLFDLQCSGEGETYSYRIMLMKTDTGLVTVQDGQASTYVRCD